MEDQARKKRVIAYVDGFNLYYGLCESNYRRYLWINIRTLAQRLIRPDQELVCTKYFTARISGARPTDNPSYAAKRNSRRERQSLYLDALGTVGDLKIIYGQYLDKAEDCRKCGATWNWAEEKMTDVNIATEMIFDAFANRYDVALLISGDSDLTPPIKAIKANLSSKRINVAMPPSRSSAHLIQVADGECMIGRGTLKKSQFPDEVQTKSGRVLKRPPEWA